MNFFFFFLGLSSNFLLNKNKIKFKLDSFKNKQTWTIYFYRVKTELFMNIWFIYHPKVKLNLNNNPMKIYLLLFFLVEK